VVSDLRPSAVRRDPPAGLAVAVVIALVGVAIAVALSGGEPDAALRHAYLVPVVGAALAWGLPGGAPAAVLAVLLHAPFVLPRVERTGLTASAVEGLATFALLLAVGSLTGVLVTWARRQHVRFETLVRLEDAVTAEPAWPGAVDRVSATLSAAVPRADVAVLVRDGSGLLASSSRPELLGAPAVADVLASGAPRFVPDTGGHARPHRLLAVPLSGREGPLGVLAVERVGELGAAERATVAALGAYIGLGLENARLAERQRRFAAELAQKVASATARLEMMDRAKSMFVATASHELRTPLTSLLGFSELLTVRRFPVDEVRRLAGLMRGETERLVRIVDDLLDLSRLERGLSPSLRRAAVDVPPLLRAAADTFRRSGVAHEFRIECSSDVPCVHADPDALDRIVKNLVSNAVKYSPPGPIHLGARRIDAGVELDVRDHGRGISPDALPRIFEPYFRDPATATAARGSGIGLAVVKALVEAHGGTIAVESAPASGTRVRFTMPSVP
jgi:signal transduction histidine kinase